MTPRIVPTEPRRPWTADRIAVLAITLAALAVRLHTLEHQPLWSDEGLSLHRAGLGLADLLRGRVVVDGYPTTDPMPPLYFALLAAARRALGHGIWAARFATASLGASVAPLAWQAGRRVAGTAAGIAAAALAAASPVLVWYGQELRPYALLAAGVMAMTAIAAARTPPVGRAARWAAVTAVTTALHPFALLAAASHAPFVLPAAWRAAGRRLRLAIALPCAAALAIALPAAARILLGPAQVDFGAVRAGTVGAQALAAFAVGISPSLTQPWQRIAPLAALAIAGALAGAADRRTRRGALLALAGCAGPLLAIVAMSAWNPIYNGPRHALVALPGFLLLAAAGAGQALSQLPSRPYRRPERRPAGVRTRALARSMGVGATALLVAALAVAAEQLARQFSSPDYVKDDVRTLVADLAVRYRSGDTIVLHDALIGFTFDAETAELGVRLPWIAVPHFPTEDRAAAAARLAAHAPSGDGRLWFVDRPEPRGGFDRTRLVGVADDRWALLDRRQYSRMWLKVGLREYAARAADAADAADTADTAASPTTERAPVAAWSNGLRLIGAGAPTDAAPGGPVRVRTTWRLDDGASGEAAWELRLVRDGGPAVSLGSDRLAALPRSDGGEPAAAGEAGAAVWTAWLEGIVPVDAPAGRGTLEVRLVDIGSGAPSRVDPAADPAAGPWAALGTIDVGRSALGARALRRLQVRRPGWRAAPLRFAGDGPAWRLVASSAVPATAAPAGRMALDVTWQRESPSGPDAERPPRAELRLVDAAGREAARAYADLPMPITGGLATASITLAVPGSARGALRVQTALAARDAPSDAAPFDVMDRWQLPCAPWIDIGVTRAVPAASSASAGPEPHGGEGLSARRPSITLAVAPYRPRPRAD